jgi:hypothetical protein
MIPSGDAFRRPARFPVVTALIILINVFVVVRELMGSDSFVMEWSAISCAAYSGRFR